MITWRLGTTHAPCLYRVRSQDNICRGKLSVSALKYIYFAAALVHILHQAVLTITATWPRVSTLGFLSPCRPVAESKLKNDYRFAAGRMWLSWSPGSCPPEGVTHCHPAPDTAIIPTQIIAVPATQQHSRHQHYTSDSLAGPRLHLRFSFTHLIFLLMIFGFHQTHTLEIWGWISKKWVRMRVKVRG